MDPHRPSDSDGEAHWSRRIEGLVGALAQYLAVYLRHRYEFFHTRPFTTHVLCLLPVLLLFPGGKRERNTSAVPVACLALVVTWIFDWLLQQAAPPVSPVAFLVACGVAFLFVVWRRHVLERDERERERAEKERLSTQNGAT